MKKEHLIINEKSEQRDKLHFYEAVTSMVNGRKYLADIGFKQVDLLPWDDKVQRGNLVFSENNPKNYSLQILQFCSKIVCSDGSELESDDFKTNSIDTLLKKVAETQGDYKRPKWGYIYDRDSLLLTSMQRDDWKAQFNIADITRKGRFFITRPFLYTPSKYSLSCNLVLSKTVIRERDVSEFDEIVAGLGRAMHNLDKKVLNH